MLGFGTPDGFGFRVAHQREFDRPAVLGETDGYCSRIVFSINGDWRAFDTSCKRLVRGKLAVRRPIERRFVAAVCKPNQLIVRIGAVGTTKVLDRFTLDKVDLIVGCVRVSLDRLVAVGRVVGLCN